jgi:hypothetical protein
MSNCFYINLGDIKGFNELLYDKNESTSILKLKKIDCKTENNQKYKLISYADIFLAKQNGEDIHRYPHKHHKLEIVSDSYSEFGQFLVDHDKVYKND